MPLVRQRLQCQFLFQDEALALSMAGNLGGQCRSAGPLGDRSLPRKPSGYIRGVLGDAWATSEGPKTTVSDGVKTTEPRNSTASSPESSVSGTVPGTFHRLDDGQIVIAAIAHQFQKSWKRESHAPEKRPIASAPVHKIRWHFSA